VIIFSGIVLLLVIPPNIIFAQVDSINQGVYPVNSKPYGLTYGQWAAKWWQWLFSIPEENNPAGDEIGKNCAEGQKGPVWFLAGTFGGKLERSCTIPQGKAIFFLVIGAECSTAEFPRLKTEPELLECAKALNEGATGRVIIDGTEVQNFEDYRVQTGLFNMTMPVNNVLGVEAGTTTAAADGWNIMLEPLSPGTHEISFGGSVVGNPTTGTESYVTDVTYHVTIK
jgi:hypothetical protein